MLHAPILIRADERAAALAHVVEPAIILIININGRVAAPLLLVAGTLRGHLGWWWARWSAPGHGHSGHRIDDITIVSWKIVEISPDLTLFSKPTGSFKDLCG